MISERYRFLFVHRGKSAGNSLSEALLPFSEDEKVILNAVQDGVERFNIINRTHGTKKHDTLEMYSSRLPPEMFAGLFKFAVLRNPFTRLVSAYFSPHRVLNGKVNGFVRDDFLQIIARQRTFRDACCLPGAARLDENLDRILRFEALPDDFATLAEEIGLPEVPTLGIRNKGGVRDWQSCYDRQTVALVRTRFGEEIEFGGYEVPST